MSNDRSLKILILGPNFAPEIVSIPVYTAGLAGALAAHGHEVAVVAGKPFHPASKVADGFRGGWVGGGVENGVDVTRAAH